MQKTKKLNEKIVAGLIVFAMMFSNFATLGNALVSFAAEEDITYSAQFVLVNNNQANEEDAVEESSEQTQENELNTEQQQEGNRFEGTIQEAEMKLRDEVTEEDSERPEQEESVTEENSEQPEQDESLTEENAEQPVQEENLPEETEEQPEEETEEQTNNFEGYAIEITLGVKDQGYLRNSKIEIKDLENQIYKIREDVSLGEYIQSIDNNKIKVKQINSGTEVKIYIPIELKDDSQVDITKFQSGTQIDLLTTYVDSEGNEEIITKSEKPVLGIPNEFNLIVDSNVEKCIPYVKDGTNQALVQLKVEASAETKSILPIKDTQLEVVLPQAEGATISDVNVSSISTSYTNGLSGTDSIFTVENWNYQDGKVTISVDNVEKDGKYSMGSGKDEYIISYTYSNYQDLSNEVLHSTVTGKSNVFVSTGTAEISNSREKDYNLSEANSNIVTYQVTRKTQEMSKGYLYANANSDQAEYELEFENALNINISRTDLINSVEVREADEYFVDVDGNRYATATSDGNNSYYKSVKLNKDNLNSIIGENGNFEILLEDGTSLIQLTKDTEDDGDGYITVTFGENRINKIIFKVNNPEKEGILNVGWVKAVDKTTYEKIDLSLFRSLNNDYVGTAQLTEGITSDIGETSVSTELLDTTTNATVSLSRNELSTLVRNDDVQVSISFNNASPMSDMYKNPVFELTFPKEIQNVEITDINLLYSDNQLDTTNIETLRNSNNQVVIRITLQGAQSRYLLGDQEKGTQIILNTNVTVDMYSSSKDTALVMNYYNEDATNYAISSDWNMMSAPSANMINPRQGTYDTSVKIVAPEGFVNAQMITGYKGDESVISVDQGRKEALIDTFTDAKIAQMKMIVINNTDEDMEDVHILGRTIFTGNKSIIDDEDLGTNQDAPMTSKIDAGDATVYYSENGEATDKLDDPANGWTTDPVSIRGVKSYLIVVNQPVKIGDMLTFDYDFEIPANLTNNLDLVGTFGSYYTGTKTVGVGEPDKVVLTTGDAPVLKVETISNIDETSAVEGQRIKYTVKISNEGRSVAEDVVVNSIIPAGTTYVENGELRPDVSELKIEVDEIGAGESKDVSYEVEVNKSVADRTYIETNSNVSAKGLEKPIYTTQEPKPIQQALAEVKLSADKADRTILGGVNLVYTTTVVNTNFNKMTNCSVIQKVPENVEVIDSYVEEFEEDGITEKRGNDGIYDPINRTVTWNVDNIRAFKCFKLEIRTNDIINETEKALVSSTTLISNDLDREYTSNELIYNLVAPKLDISSYTSNDNKYIKEGDSIKYILKIENNGKGEARNIDVQNAIPSELRVTEVTCNKPGYTYSGLAGENVDLKLTLLAGETAEIVVNCTAENLSNSIPEKVTANNWIVSGDNLQTTQTKEVQNIIRQNPEVSNNTYEELAIENKTEQLPKDTIKLNEKVNERSEDNNSSLNNYTIFGVAFEDSNKNGQRDDDESRLSNITVKLCDAETQEVVQQTTTNAAGEYFLENLAKGEYYIKFEYDSTKYQVTEYQKQGVTADRNSDAIISNYKAVTDKIVISDNSISDIDIGLISAGIFDLSLDVNVNRIMVQDDKETNTYTMENSKLAKVDINPKNANTSKVFVEYTVTVANKGETVGYAKRIVDYLPKEFELDSTLNPNWYVGADGNAYTQQLENDLINPGETRTITLVLTKQMTEDAGGIVNNTFEIAQSYNEYAIADIDSVEGNQAEGEDDLSRADVILGIQTGGSMINIMIISTTLITLLIALYVIKVYIDKKNKEVIV